MTDERDETGLCGRCGAAPGARHAWVEGDCVLPHRSHARARVGFCCEPCLIRWQEWIAEIVRLFDTLPSVIPLGSVPDTTAHHSHVRRRAASPAAMRLDAWSMVRDRDRLFYTGNRADLPDVPAVLSDLAYRLHDALATHPARSYDADYGSAAAFLASHVSDLALQDWCPEADADLRWMRSHLRRAHGITDPVALGHCQSVIDGQDCGGRVWEPEDPKERPRCDRCRRAYGPLDLVRLKIMEEGAA